MLFKLKKPNTPKNNSKKNLDLILKYLSDQENIGKYIEKSNTPEYLYWDTVKHKSIPKNMSAEDFWGVLKFSRKIQSIPTIIKDEKSNNYFSWIKLSNLEEFLHNVDLNTGGSLFSFAKDTKESDRNKFVSRGVMEEAIASSQLEGAHTTRKIAKEFLIQGRKPKNKSEQMILNNYNTMSLIESEYKDKELTLELIFELHSLITKETVKEEERGRFRFDEENIVVTDKTTGVVYHIPPKRKFIEKEIEKLIDFANDKGDQAFIHPVIKAIMIHFWVGYLHPFTDGNGRVARLLFYWYLLRHNYWAFAYLPISKIIKKSPVQYGKAYIYSEQDDLDLTYFIDYNICKIKQAIEEFNNYLEAKAKENSLINKSAKTKYALNDRQIQLLQFLYSGDKDDHTTPTTHMKINQISKKTAIKDLKDLEVLGFLKRQKVKRNVFYFAGEKINLLFNK